MDRVKEIIELESVAAGKNKVVSANRWFAARLIWEEVTDGKSRRELGEEIGKSHTHVRYMYNCWNMIGRKLSVSGSEIVFPDFQEIYMSEEIRGEAKEKKHTKKKREQKQEKEQEDTSAHGMIAKAAELIRIVADNTAFWDTLTYEDIEVVSGIINDAEEIVEGCKV